MSDRPDLIIPTADRRIGPPKDPEAHPISTARSRKAYQTKAVPGRIIGGASWK